jgi:hypothetical protein
MKGASGPLYTVLTMVNNIWHYCCGVTAYSEPWQVGLPRWHGFWIHALHAYGLKPYFMAGHSLFLAIDKPLLDVCTEARSFSSRDLLIY